ncbi:unnamed protein product [Bursaphelenchus okinawaensis]|uniref:7TM_GPCR_Srx domain-containing protein n=1 Tax=Bursaphelenchus okinawaensis TaxID=465554 RepID=A0A811JRM9_9BILA|nr:unnamed protein product [Bursaphelenchus okinawaensis]CAG9079287.1 unnamed protein product [Bursaphelenchus okinawaensis]
MGVLVKPDPIFPCPGAKVSGVLKYLGEDSAIWSDVAIVNSAGYAISTQCVCIMYRFAVLQDDPRFLELMLSGTAWFIGYFISALVTFLTVWMFKKVQAPQSTIPTKISEMIKQFPDMEIPKVEGNYFIYMDYDSEYSVYAGALIFIGFIAAEFLSITSVYLILKQLEVKKASFSQATYKLHRQLTIALGVQVNLGNGAGTYTGTTTSWLWYSSNY